MEFERDTPLAQQPLSPANAMEAVSIAAATKTVVVILIMVNAQTDLALRRSIFILANSAGATRFTR